MSEFITCPQCGSSQPTRQNFCGECGSPLREGVTRPLTTGERAAVEEHARRAATSARPTLTETWSGREPQNRRPLLLVGLVALLMIGLGVWRFGPQDAPVAPAPPPIEDAGGSSLVAGAAEPTPAEFRLAERGVGMYLGAPDPRTLRPSTLITLTRTIVQPSSVPTSCAKATSTMWLFAIETLGPNNANIILDQPGIRLVDSTGRVYRGAHQCRLELSDIFAAPFSLLPGSKSTATVTLDVDELSAAATYLDLHMLISGQRFAFRTPYP